VLLRTPQNDKPKVHAIQHDSLLATQNVDVCKLRIQRDVPAINRNALRTPPLDNMYELPSCERPMGFNDNNDTSSKVRTLYHAGLQASPMENLFGLCTTFAACARLFDRAHRAVVHSDDVQQQSSNLHRHMQRNKG